AGGSVATGCTVTNSNGNFTCSGSITGGSTGTVGYWTRTGTTLEPATTNDNVKTNGTGVFLTTNGTNAAPSYTFVSSTGTGLYLPTTNALGLTTAGLERVRVDASGNVGIGTTAAAGNRLETSGGDVKVNLATAGSVLVTGSGSVGSQIRFNGNTNSYIQANGGSNELLQIGTISGGSIIFNVNNLEKARFDQSGNLGIATSTPQQKLTLGSGNNFAIELTTPTGPTASPTTGGTLASNTYYYKITALDGIGETAGSAEVSATVSNPTTNAVV